ncbi:alpha/beta fold hydrolase [Streptomyces sp. NBC_00083]|uniref:alpha/beta hydrolase n=1 Tax=Streptomyces sp. NBC_00083 TaxID=2975647 RepID=UPI00225BA3B4|nr:alpha/beta hydrolase [Streptomyces sp. NBC_00083]MCX5386944.1 alpha/beta hydrolase [Streptomyces sp. NBC_00083]
MQLNTRTWGEGDRIALLIHGIMADHRTWRKVGPALAARGYRVIAVDLRGHGASGRGEYTAELFADDLVETLPAGAELALGHSLGGLSLSLAVERLRPSRAVYSDPAWSVNTPQDTAGSEGISPDLFAQFKSATREMVAGLNPRWEDEDVDIELETLKVWDENTAFGLATMFGADLAPAKAVIPSLVQFAEASFLYDAAEAARLRARGFEVRTVKGAGHTLHRDDFEGFMASLDGWI